MRDIDTMPAGREMDALVAKRVMGDEVGDFGWNALRTRHFRWRHHGVISEEPEPYSTDIAAAWQVVEKMQSDGWEFDISTHEVSFERGKYEAPDYRCSVVVPAPYGTQGIPLAICRAALKAVTR